MQKKHYRVLSKRIHQVLDRQIFFVGGAPKSGTTWLQKALDAHPEIMCSGEGHFLDKFALNLNEMIKDYNKHQAVVAQNVYQGKPYYQSVEC